MAFDFNFGLCLIFMKVSLKWLKEYVDLKLTPKELAERLTMAGMEVKTIETIGATWNNIVVGQITAINPHPNADRLKLATVDIGKGSPTVVCGAPNISVGQKVPFASVGAQLIDGHTGETILLKPAKIRGIASEGMVCSEKELGISDNHEGIMVLPPEAPLSIPLSEYLGDAILDIDVTPNRPDCLSIIGVAREIAAITGEKVHLPELHYEESETPINSFVSVNIVEPELCSRYCASLVLNLIQDRPSPDWLQQRLKNCGMRPISNIVDVTNYVMLEYGQPLHAFDYHSLKEGNGTPQIIVRRAADDEKITSLDGVARTLNPAILVIADKERPVAIAGIMGGWDTEVTKETNTVLLESANFNQATIRRGSNHLRLQNEASLRFDKGLNPNLAMPALKRATQLLLQMAGGKAARGIVDAYPGKSEPKMIAFSAYEVERLTGLKVGINKITGVLSSLGFVCQEISPSQISVSPPYWRSDIKSAADLVEEVVRIIGYDKVPVTRLGSSLPQQESMLSLGAQRSNLKKKLRNFLVGCGFQETVTYTLVSLEKLQKLSPNLELKIPPLKVANPMTREQEYLRTNLRAGLLSTFHHNQRHEPGGIRLFEIGKVFLPQHPSHPSPDKGGGGEGLLVTPVVATLSETKGKQSQGERELPWEKEMLCAVLSGPRAEMSWRGDTKPIDFFDAKGIIEALMNQLKLKTSFKPNDNDPESSSGLTQEARVNIISEKEEVGIVGLLHPKVAKAFELSGEVYLIEIDLEKLLKIVHSQLPAMRYQPIQRFPNVSRDIALVVDEEIPYKKVAKIVQSFPLVTKVTLFDLYRGEQIPKGKKSFALRITYQSPERTLTDEEIDQIQQQMLDKLNLELGATLRSNNQKV